MNNLCAQVMTPHVSPPCVCLLTLILTIKIIKKMTCEFQESKKMF